MSFTRIWITRLLIALIAVTLGGGPQLAQAQQQQPPEQQPTQQTPTNPGGKVDPSRAPLSPVPAQPLPDSPSAQQDNTQQQPAQQPTPPPQKPITRPVSPVGVAAAEAQPTAGGAASKPAGNAIAPAKQKQYRSLIIKLGALAGAGIAIGTVYALTKGTKSTPPGAVR